MDPVTAFAMASGGAKALSALHTGYAQVGQQTAQAGAAAYNRDLAYQNADTVSVQANLREEQMRREARQVQGAQRAGVAESGTGFGGSNLDVMRQDATTAALDALNARYEGALQRTSYFNEGQAQDFQRRVLKKAASASKVGGWIGAGSSLLGGVSSYVSGGGKLPAFGR